MEQEDFFKQEEKPEYLQYKDKFRLYCIYRLAAYIGALLAGLLSFLSFVPSLKNNLPSLKMLKEVAQNASWEAISIYLRLAICVVFAGVLIASIVEFSKALLKEWKNLHDLESYALKEYNAIKARQEKKTRISIKSAFACLVVCIFVSGSIFWVVLTAIGVMAMPVCNFLSKKIYNRIRKDIIAKEYKQ